MQILSDLVLVVNLAVHIKIQGEKHMKIPKDDRNPLWAEIESKIQERADKKDPDFSLSGQWKKFVRDQDSFKIFSVDGEWVRNNLSIMFHHGGHGYVHEFIPLDEIWIETHHCHCNCKNVRNGQKISMAFFESTIVHEITELELMKKGVIYWDAHQLAIQKEREIGLLKDPYEDNED